MPLESIDVQGVHIHTSYIYIYYTIYIYDIYAYIVYMHKFYILYAITCIKITSTYVCVSMPREAGPRLRGMRDLPDEEVESPKSRGSQLGLKAATWAFLRPTKGKAQAGCLLESLINHGERALRSSSGRSSGSCRWFGWKTSAKLSFELEIAACRAVFPPTIIEWRQSNLRVQRPRLCQGS